MGSRPWSFGVTRRHRSCDHLTHGGRPLICGPLWPFVVLAPLWRYGRLKFFQEGSSRQEGGQSSVGRSVRGVQSMQFRQKKLSLSLSPCVWGCVRVSVKCYVLLLFPTVDFLLACRCASWWMRVLILILNSDPTCLMFTTLQNECTCRLVRQNEFVC